MKRLLNESLKTLTVTTLHPLGWSLTNLRRHLSGEKNVTVPTNPVQLAHEHACPIVLVHGIFHNATAFYGLEKKLSARGFSMPRTIELWTSVDSLDAMIDQFKSEVMRLYEVQRQQNIPGGVRIVAHSLGGMVVRAALLDEDFTRHIDKIVFLGTPHQGHPLYRLPIPKCLRSLTPGSPFMKRMNAEPLPAGIDYWNLRGGILDFVTPLNQTFLPHVNNVTFHHVGHAGLLVDHHVIQSVISILETPKRDKNAPSAEK